MQIRQALIGIPSGNLMEIHSPTQRALRVSELAAQRALQIQIV
jgi:hypothetical protein